jgi:hypothetical protein
MRRFTKSLGLLIVFALALCVFAQPASAQMFRAQRFGPRPFFNNNPFFLPNPFAPINVRQAPFIAAQTGQFNPSTGAFSPNALGTSVLQSRVGFQPTRGVFTPTTGGPFVLTTRDAFDPRTNRFVPSPVGNFIVRTPGTFTPSLGSFQQFSTGSLNPFTGGFSPTPNGNVTLSSNGVFIPSNGTFVPTPLGNFQVTQRAFLNPFTGFAAPASNGNVNFTTRGIFVPSNQFATATGMPVPTIATNFNPTPFNLVNANFLAARQVAALTNPYFAWGGPYNPYGIGNPYFPTPYNATYNNNPYYGSYYPPYNAYGQGYGSNYGSGANVYASNQVGGAAANNNIPAFNPQADQAKQPTALGAFGVPSDNGNVKWPLAFRLMSPDQRREMLEPMESQLRVAATQAASGKANPKIADEARVSVAKLRQWLRGRRPDLAEGTFMEADRFLRRIDDALDAIKS